MHGTPEQRIFVRGQRYFDDLIRGIARARKSVDFETYIFELDGLGNRILHALMEAASRGVRVRLMVDGFGSFRFGEAQAALLTGAGGECRVFHPAPWQFWLAGMNPRRPFLEWVLHSFQGLNRRNHRKTCVVDGREAWIGSQNVTVKHLPARTGGEGWRDTGVRIAGICATEVAELFERGWEESAGPGERRRHLLLGRKAPVHHCAIRSNETRKKRMRHLRELVGRIRNAKDRVWLTSPYFFPTVSVVRAISRSARRGVDVRLLLPGPSDVPPVKWASAVYFGILLNSGVRIYEYQPSVLHAKTLIVDDWVTVGSTNLNQRSFRHDLEIDAVIDRPGAVARLLAQFRRDIRRSALITPDAWESGYLLRKFLGRIMLIWKRYL